MFFDDILIYSKNMKDNVEHLKVTLRLLMQHHLYARRSKCQFVVASVKYLRYYILTEESLVILKRS